MADEEQLDEVLEELWVLAEHGEIAEVERMEVHGALPVSLAIEKMIEMGLVVSAPHPPEPHDHKPFVNPCHDALKPVATSVGDGTLIVELTPRGRRARGKHYPPAPAGGAAIYRQSGDGQRVGDRAAGVQVRAHSLAGSDGQDLHVSGASADVPARGTDSAGAVLRNVVGFAGSPVREAVRSK